MKCDAWRGEVTAFPAGIRVPQGRRVAVDWAGLVRALSSPIVRPDIAADPAAKQRLPAWSPCVFSEDRRSLARARSVCAIVLDYDAGDPPDRELARWAPWARILHTSWSHAEDAPRYRIVLPLAHPVRAERWGRVWAWAWRHSGGRIDRSCKDPSRAYFRPALRGPGAAWRVEVCAGDACDLDAETLPPGLDERSERPPPPPPAYDPHPTIAALQRRRHLAADPSARLSAGLGAGGVASGAGSGSRVDRIPCPQCARPSVWFWVDPVKASGATCKHRESCGWYGPVDVL